MSETMKRVTLTVLVNVAVEVDVDVTGGEVSVVSVSRINGLPTATDVMEALDGAGDYAQLDRAYEVAGGILP